jgi:hypothetical protein
MYASQRANTATPDSLRQRQRDRLVPRGRDSKDHRIATTVREVLDVNQTPVRLSPVPRAKAGGSLSPEGYRKRPIQDGLREEDMAYRRAKTSVGEVRVDIVPDSTSASREGRQFAVSNVGNNGRIYLRYAFTRLFEGILLFKRGVLDSIQPLSCRVRGALEFS